MSFAKFSLSVVVACACGLAATPAFAQSVNYMDEAGNIHFADSPSDVPEKYRPQLQEKKKIRLSRRDYAQYKASIERERRKIEAKKQREEKERQRELKQKQREQERQRMLNEKAAKKAAEK